MILKKKKSLKAIWQLSFSKKSIVHTTLITTNVCYILILAPPPSPHRWAAAMTDSTTTHKTINNQETPTTKAQVNPQFHAGASKRWQLKERKEDLTMAKSFSDPSTPWNISVDSVNSAARLTDKLSELVLCISALHWYLILDYNVFLIYLRAK